MYRIDNWVNQESGWIIESVNAEYVNISIFSPLWGSTYTKVQWRLRNSVKYLINIKNDGYKCFLWCHIKHLNPLKWHPERITKADKRLVNDLGYDIKFLVSEKDFGKTEKKSICICCYKSGLVYPVFSDQTFENSKDL